MKNTPRLAGPETSLMPQNIPAAAPLFRIDLVVNNAHEMSLLLDQAVQQLILTALEHRRGILVTQIFPNTYTVEVDESVLCGVVQENGSTLEPKQEVARTAGHACQVKHATI